MIENHFGNDNPANVVFDPIPSYSGNWLFTIENLRKNAIVNHGINLFDEFYKKTYQEPLEKLFKTPRVLDFQVGMVSKPNKDNVGRCLQYSKIDFFVELTTYLNQSIDNYGLSTEENEKRLKGLISHLKNDNEDLNHAYSDALREKARRLKDVLEKEFNSEFFEAVMKDYAPYKDRITFSEYIKVAYKITSDFQVGLLRLGDFFDRNLDYHALYETIDVDKFCLLFAKIIYEYNLIKENEENVLDNSYGYLCRYKQALDSVIREDKKYNPRILFTLRDGKKLRYSRWQFMSEFSKLMERHPEADAIKLPILEDENHDKYKDISLMEKLTSLYADETRVNWEFLPEGECIKRGDSNIPNSTVTCKKKSREELINEVNLRITILENSGFIGRPIKGLNTFSGYYAFIYPNGKVILEKFWEHEGNLTPALGTATYVMNIDNFVEMSKISRINLVEYIKTLPEVGVKRIFHTSINNWQRNLYDEINGTYRLEDAINFINTLKTGEVRND